jgi:hypothetical protein
MASQTQSLAKLKNTIAGSPKLGSIPAQFQRLFHLGRELKTAGRSLEALGVGRFGVFVVHVHSTMSPEKLAATAAAQQQQHVLEIVESPVPPPPRHTNNTKPQRSMSIVDLADDSSDDDSDDDCVVVEEAPASKRKRR